MTLSILLILTNAFGISDFSTVTYNYGDYGSNPGSFTVTLTVTNAVSNQTVSASYVLQRTVAETALISDLSTTSFNVTTYWSIDLGTLGTDACYFINFDDPLARAFIWSLYCSLTCVTRKLLVY